MKRRWTSDAPTGMLSERITRGTSKGARYEEQPAHSGCTERLDAAAAARRGLASAFGLLTVAEGVETAEQFKLLRLLSCDQSQGYFHCPPVAAREIDRLLAQDS